MIVIGVMAIILYFMIGMLFEYSVACGVFLMVLVTPVFFVVGFWMHKELQIAKGKKR